MHNRIRDTVLQNKIHCLEKFSSCY